MFYLNKIEDLNLPELPVLGRTLPSLLEEAGDRAAYPSGNRNHSDRAFNQWQANNWQSLSHRELLTAAEELAWGLLEELEPKEKVAFLMHSDLNFCIADFGTLQAGLVNVPIDLTQTLENIAFILRHSAAKALIVSNLDLLAQVIPYLCDTPDLQTVIVVDIPDDWEEKRTQLLTCGVHEFGVRNSEFGVNSSKEKGWDSTSSSLDIKQETTNYKLLTPNSPQTCLCVPMLLCQGRKRLSCPELPQCVRLFSLDEVRARGKELKDREQKEQSRSPISPQDLATIVYIAGDTGQPKGVMLSHENITADILTTFKSIPDLKPGKTETVLSFLPLTHIFARALIYGHLNYGHNIYFSTPNRAVRDFKTVRPTLVATVPRLLEKSYQKILDRGSKLRGIKKTIFNWALKLAQNYELGQPMGLSYALQLKLADWLVFSQWRKPFGGRLKYFISGGAPLTAELANIFSAAGMTVLQGYGLTETSSVICCNRDSFNRAGTVGLPIPGVKMAIAPDGEILVKAPYVMQGYYKNPEATEAVIDREGWLHTGDLGEFTSEGFLTITGNKKELFKLSTGKYVTPQPLEERVKQSSLVRQAVVVGRQKKFCGMLIFPDLEQLRERARALNLYLPIAELLQQPEIIALYQTVVDEANQQLPQWSRVKGFRLLDPSFFVAEELLQANGKIDRSQVNKIFAAEIDALYGEETTSITANGRSLVQKFRVQSWELSGFKLLIARLKLLSWRVVQDYFQRQNLDFWQKMGIDEQDKSSKFRIPFISKDDNSQLQTQNPQIKEELE
ncbi:MAG: long-chain fatty acid--CoA ligase [Pleurocapsa sp. MO_226.B13]|nr:long-chain fatty acid--CoA ligase [Pleurocapsa sp. MO_226.B13]